MIADKTFMTYFLSVFYPTAPATAFGQRPKFVKAKHSATAVGENWAYGPTLPASKDIMVIKLNQMLILS